MLDYLNKSFATTLYIGGAFAGIAGGCMVVVMGAVAIMFGTPLVTGIMIAAGISALGLTIGDYGRKKLRALQAAAPRYVRTATIKQAG